MRWRLIVCLPGQMEQIEFVWYPPCHDHSLPPSFPLLQWYSFLCQATEPAYKPIAYNMQTRQILVGRGFAEVVEQIIRVPLNSWPKDTHEHDIGQWCLLRLDPSNSTANTTSQPMHTTNHAAKATSMLACIISALARATTTPSCISG